MEKKGWRLHCRCSGAVHKHHIFLGAKHAEHPFTLMLRGKGGRGAGLNFIQFFFFFFLTVVEARSSSSRRWSISLATVSVQPLSHGAAPLSYASAVLAISLD